MFVVVQGEGVDKWAALRRCMDKRGLPPTWRRREANIFVKISLFFSALAGYEYIIDCLV
jgi:hypothetical protein